MTLKRTWATTLLAALAATPLCLAAVLFSGCNATAQSTAAPTPAPAKAEDPKQNFYVYLCFGQSNMEGFPGIPAAETNIDSMNGRFELLTAVDFPQMGRKADTWVPAVPPLCRPGTGMCPADYFGRTLVENLPKNIKIGVINVSVAGCKIEMFDKEHYKDYLADRGTGQFIRNIAQQYGGDPYQRLVDLGKEAQKDGVIKGILLHQGESNSGDAQWGTKVKGVYDNLVKDLNLKPEDTPLFMGETVNGGNASMMTKATQLIPNSYLIDSKGCGLANNLHFSPDGYKKLGTRYAIKELELLKVKPNEDTTQRAQ